MSGALIPFTPAPQVEREHLSEYHAHASLSAYIEREAPQLHAQGESAALAELEALAAAMQERLTELDAQLKGNAGGTP